MPYDDGESGRDIAAQQSARTLQGAQELCAEAIYHLDRAIQGDPRRAVIETQIGPDNPMPDIHAALLLYFRQLEPHLIKRARAHYSGAHYDEPIATVRMETGPDRPGFGRTDTETIDGLGDLTDWEMRTVDIGRSDSSRMYLSPDAVVSSYRKLIQVQAGIGLLVEPRQEQHQDPSEVSTL